MNAAKMGPKGGSRKGVAMRTDKGLGGPRLKIFPEKPGNEPLKTLGEEVGVEGVSGHA